MTGSLPEVWEFRRRELSRTEFVATAPSYIRKTSRLESRKYLMLLASPTGFEPVLSPDHAGSPRQSLWSFTVERVQRMTGETHAKEAAVALWALLHGAATLEAGQVHGENKPASGFEFGLNAWLLLAETPSSASRTMKSVR
jgi:hypothetical protein